MRNAHFAYVKLLFKIETNGVAVTERTHRHNDACVDVTKDVRGSEKCIAARFEYAEMPKCRVDATAAAENVCSARNAIHSIFSLCVMGLLATNYYENRFQQHKIIICKLMKCNAHTHTHNS